jgi:hypothetical protein
MHQTNLNPRNMMDPHAWRTTTTKATSLTPLSTSVSRISKAGNHTGKRRSSMGLVQKELVKRVKWACVIELVTPSNAMDPNGFGASFYNIVMNDSQVRTLPNLNERRRN